MWLKNRFSQNAAQNLPQHNDPKLHDSINKFVKITVPWCRSTSKVAKNQLKDIGYKNTNKKNYNNRTNCLFPVKSEELSTKGQVP